MLLPKSNDHWKATNGRLPSTRKAVNIVKSRRFLIFVAVVCSITILWRSISSSASDMQSFYCWGPPKAPMDMTQNELSRWSAHMQTPVMYNQHKPIEVKANTIEKIDLNPVTSTIKAVTNEEKILILTPLKDAAPYLGHYFDLLSQLSYPHHLIDVAFLVSDSNDDTEAVLASELDRLQSRPDKVPFRSATIISKDFGSFLKQDVEDRHGYEAQAPRRKGMAKARNFLLASALKPDHSWVYWRDVDIQESPESIIEDFVAHDRDIIVPNIWFHRLDKDGVDIEGRYDYNSWIESPKALALAAKLDKDTVIVEGYKEFKTGRDYMCLKGDRRKNKDEELLLDGIGGVSILVKADVHRAGINFPSYAFENQAETEGFAKMARRAGYQVVGLPNYVVWHVDTDEKGGNA